MYAPRAEAESIPALQELKNVLAEQRHSYVCGGRIPIAANANSSAGEAAPAMKQALQSDPITIRWDVSGLSEADESPCGKLTLPVAKQVDRDALNALMRDCQPATFGLGRQDVYDETYRKALKMDPDEFCTTFDPYFLEIVDTIAQILLPSYLDSATHRAVEARLYKLNVYSGPSGMFKAHVDTPRSPTQFGSLVVCLPVEHQGGQLKVRHQGEETTFDGSMLANHDKTAHIEWEAFYSDCEHEVMEVSAGNRLTLTYNLFAVPGAGRLTGQYLTLDPTHLPLYRAVKRMMSLEPFSGKGGMLGFWCSHVYAYNNATEVPLPETLKGVDAALWETFKALGIDVKIAPVIQDDDMVGEAFEHYKGRVKEIPSEWIVGKKFGLELHSWEVHSFEEYNELYTSWGSYLNKMPTYWLTEPVQREPQIYYTAHGNQASTDVMYSSCAILATLPPKESAATDQTRQLSIYFKR
ncbi:hypothetical protein NHJ6243_006478 [Beauveria neobassiana]